MENREILQLTTQMLSELSMMEQKIFDIMDTIVVQFMSQVKESGSPTQELIETIHVATAEINTYKVRFENMLIETDIKEKVYLQLRAQHKFPELNLNLSKLDL